MTRDPRTSRRDFLAATLGVPAALALPGAARAQARRPTPACDDDPEPTPPQTEGPYFTPNSPLRRSLVEPGTRGTRIVVAGRVLSTRCAPVPRALIDVWHADDDGEYDNAGYRMRGHQFTDEQGGYRFESIVPGIYPGRTRHFHVKVQAPGQPVLTTQLYFPGEPRNAADRIFHPDLVLDVKGAGGAQAAAFDFVLRIPTARTRG